MSCILTFTVRRCWIPVLFIFSKCISCNCLCYSTFYLITCIFTLCASVFTESIDLIQPKAQNPTPQLLYWWTPPTGVWRYHMFLRLQQCPPGVQLVSVVSQRYLSPKRPPPLVRNHADAPAEVCNGTLWRGVSLELSIQWSSASNEGSALWSSRTSRCRGNHTEVIFHWQIYWATKVYVLKKVGALVEKKRVLQDETTGLKHSHWNI